MTELIAPPERGRVFALNSRPGLADCAPSGRIRLDALARWLQDVAYADVEDAGLADSAVWVVRRTRLRVLRFPRFAERFTVRTFCSGLGRMWAERRTTISHEQRAAPDVEAVSLWVHLDPLSWRPMPFSDAELSAYGDTGAQRRVSARLRHPPVPDAPASALSWSFRATECDIAGHINNAAYWQPLEEELLGTEELATFDGEIEYRAQCQPGEIQVIRDGARRWLVGADGTAHASLLIGKETGSWRRLRDA